MAEIVAMPKLGFDMAEGKLIRWMRAEGETVEQGQVLAEIETDKATVEVEAAAGGVVRKHLVDEGASVPVGTAIAIIGTADEPLPEAAPAAAAKAPSARRAPAAAAATASPASAATPAPAAVEPAHEPEGDGRLPGGRRASPLARRLAVEKGIRLGAVAGSGPGGRVTRRDVEEAVEGRAAGLGPAAETEHVALSRVRALIGRRMTQSKQQAPHFYVTAEVDAAPLMSFREELNAILGEEAKVSVNDVIVKAAALTLRGFRNLNASIEGDQIVRHGAVNIGVAVALDEGLLTVVARDADRKPLPALAREVREMVARARQGHVRSEDIEGSTFSVSNLGMFDVETFIAIINPPEAAILAVGSVREEAIVRDGQLAAGKRLKLTLSADHRVSDGVEAARFLQALRQVLEHPLRMVV
jgi:pyruvate dehydrogenase E2 component (dihydrolipoamide acetyltransferase)